jgi:hypothetical protein
VTDRPQRRFGWYSLNHWGIIMEAGGRGGARFMGAALGIAIIVLVVGCILGWHANRARTAHSDIKTTHGRIANYRRIRLRSGLIALGFILAALAIVSALVRG